MAALPPMAAWTSCGASPTAMVPVTLSVDGSTNISVESALLSTRRVSAAWAASGKRSARASRAFRMTRRRVHELLPGPSRCRFEFDRAAEGPGRGGGNGVAGQQRVERVFHSGVLPLFRLRRVVDVAAVADHAALVDDEDVGCDAGAEGAG